MDYTVVFGQLNPVFAAGPSQKHQKHPNQGPAQAPNAHRENDARFNAETFVKKYRHKYPRINWVSPIKIFIACLLIKLVFQVIRPMNYEENEYRVTIVVENAWEIFDSNEVSGLLKVRVCYANLFGYFRTGVSFGTMRC